MSKSIASPFTSAALALLFLTIPAAAATDPVAVSDVAEHFRRLERLGFAGVVLVAEEGVPLLARGYGLADRERQILWTPATVSTIGSITKQFTGAAISLLIQEGRLSLEDTLAEHFDALPEDKEKITLHQLLTHSSGIVDLEGAGDWDPIDREEFVRRTLSQSLAFPPGEGYEYSNAGYSLLGAVIEGLAGVPYEEFLRRRLLLPAGLFETGYLLPDWGERRFAQGYRQGERWGTVLERPMASDGPYWVLRANGGLHSTAYDMLRWAEALRTGRVLSPETMERYWSPHVSEGGDTFYGYGWVVMDLPDGTRVITHNGGNSIHFADLAIVPSAGLVVFLQTNVVAELPMAGGLLEAVGYRLLGGAPLPEVPDVATVEAEELEGLAGDYALSGGGAATVARSGGELRIEPRDPLAFSQLLSLRPVDAARGERLSARIDAIVSAYLQGDWELLAEAYERRVSAEFLERRWAGRMAILEERHGMLRGHRILGTAFRDGRDVTLVRFHFENGTSDRTYVWDPDAEEKLLGVSGRGVADALRVLAVTGGAFATWDPRTGTSRPMSFEKDGATGSRFRLGRGAEAVEGVRKTSPG